MVALTVDKGSSMAEGSQCVRQQADTFFPFTICGDGRVRYLRVDAQQVDLVDGNADSQEPCSSFQIFRSASPVEKKSGHLWEARLASHGLWSF